MHPRIHLPLLMLLVLPVGARAAEQCRPDCTHETKVCVCALDGRDITFTAIGGVERQPLRLRQALDPGDEIASTDQNAVVALTCPKSSSVNLHGRFRTVIMPPAQGQDCALNLLAGGADVQTNNPTQVSAGTTLMGSKRTTYAMRISSDATVACMVFEGEVQIQNLATGAAPRSLGPLASASWKRGALQQFGTPIPQADLATTARVYARAETARARALGVPLSNPAAWQRELETRHAAVLARPQDPLPRIDLAGVQTRARLTARRCISWTSPRGSTPRVPNRRPSPPRDGSSTGRPAGSRMPRARRNGCARSTPNDTRPSRRSRPESRPSIAGSRW